MQSNNMCTLGDNSTKDPVEVEFNPMTINKNNMALNNSNQLSGLGSSTKWTVWGHLGDPIGLASYS